MIKKNFIFISSIVILSVCYFAPTQVSLTFAQEDVKSYLLKSLIPLDTVNFDNPILKIKKVKKFAILAKESILNSKYKDLYKAFKPLIDTDPGMSEAMPYVFVHFLPKPDNEEENISNTTYLVVFNRLDDRVIYSGVFNIPEGDSFYKYSNVLQHIYK